MRALTRSPPFNPMMRALTGWLHPEPRNRISTAAFCRQLGTKLTAQRSRKRKSSSGHGAYDRHRLSRFAYRLSRFACRLSRSRVNRLHLIPTFEPFEPSQLRGIDSSLSIRCLSSPSSVSGCNCPKIALAAFNLTVGSFPGPSNSSSVCAALVAPCVRIPTVFDVISERIAETR